MGLGLGRVMPCEISRYAGNTMFDHVSRFMQRLGGRQDEVWGRSWVEVWLVRLSAAMVLTVDVLFVTW